MLIGGALLYALANILDCADGQLARLQGSGTLLGRVIDGVADYFSTTAIFLGIGISLSSGGNNVWWLVIGAGVSSAFHAMIFDDYQGKFISGGSGAGDGIKQEIERFTEEINIMRREHRDGMKVLLIHAYIGYLQFQHRLNLGATQRSVDPERFRKENRLMIRLWSFLGPTTNRTILIVCAFVNYIGLYLWIIVLIGNLWLIISFLLQRVINRRLEALEVIQPAIE